MAFKDSTIINMSFLTGFTLGLTPLETANNRLFHSICLWSLGLRGASYWHLDCCFGGYYAWEYRYD